MARYRNTAGILEFINYVAKSDPGEGSGYTFSELSKESDDSIQSENLPLPFGSPNEPKWKNCASVIWFKDMANAKSLLQDMVTGKPATFIFFNEKISWLAEKDESQWEYHDFNSFHDSEADVIVYYTPKYKAGINLYNKASINLYNTKHTNYIY